MRPGSRLGSFARRTCLALCAVSLPGCYSAFPLDPTPQAELDGRLLGAWRCLPPEPKADDEAVTIVFGQARERVYSIRMEEKGEQPGLYEAHVSRVKGREILNVRELEPTLASKPWAFARYSFPSANVLRIQYVDEDAFEGVEQSPAAFRKALERLPDGSSMYREYAVCVRVKTGRE